MGLPERLAELAIRTELRGVGVARLPGGESTGILFHQREQACLRQPLQTGQPRDRELCWNEIAIALNPPFPKQASWPLQSLQAVAMEIWIFLEVERALRR